MFLLLLLVAARAETQAIAMFNDELSLCNATHIVRQRIADRFPLGDAIALLGAPCAYLASAGDGMWITGNATSMVRVGNGSVVRVHLAELLVFDVVAAASGGGRLHAVTLAREHRRLEVDWAAGTVESVELTAVSLGPAAVAATRGASAADVLWATSDAVLLNSETVARAAANESFRDVALWRCAPVVLSGAGDVAVLSNVSVCEATTTTAPPRTFETAATTTADDFETEPGEGSGGPVPGFEGTVDARGAAKSRPPSLGLGVDVARRDVGFGPFSITAIVVAVLAFVVLSALIYRAMRNYIRLGNLAPNRANPWKTGD